MKTKFGMRHKSKNIKRKKKNIKKNKNKAVFPLRNIIMAAKQSITPGNDNTPSAIKSALKGARAALKIAGGKRQVKKT